MKNSSVASESQVLAVSAEYASVPMRSPATSIILAEAVRRSQEKSESQSLSRPKSGLIRNFLKFVRYANIGSAGKVSIVFTPCGPLIYQWKGFYYSPEGKAE